MQRYLSWDATLTSYTCTIFLTMFPHYLVPADLSWMLNRIIYSVICVLGKHFVRWKSGLANNMLLADFTIFMSSFQSNIYILWYVVQTLSVLMGIISGYVHMISLVQAFLLKNTRHLLYRGVSCFLGKWLQQSDEQNDCHT